MAPWISAFRMFVIPLGLIASIAVSGFFLWLGLENEWYAASVEEQTQWYTVVGIPWLIIVAAVLIWLRTKRQRFPDLLLIAAPAFHLAFFGAGTLLTKL